MIYDFIADVNNITHVVKSQFRKMAADNPKITVQQAVDDIWQDLDATLSASGDAHSQQRVDVMKAVMEFKLNVYDHSKERLVKYLAAGSYQS
jgi:hypothetical protein